MKKFKNALLSVLLFSFTFLVVHDYMMADLIASSVEEQSVNKEILHSESTSKCLCAVSHLHDSVHTMIATEIDVLPIASLVLNNKLSYTVLRFTSNNNFVLERPPLS